jgi:hypothetical protein
MCKPRRGRARMVEAAMTFDNTEIVDGLFERGSNL